MAPQALPEAVRTFLAEHIRTLDQFQLLLRLVQAPDRWWDADAAARELGMAHAVAGEALDHLAKQNLLDIRITGDVRYRFRPGTETLRRAALETTEAFRQRPLDVLTVITGSGRHGIRDFADAFRIRRDDDR